MTGIFRKTRCLALIIPILCLAVATAAAPAHTTTNPTVKITGLNCSKTTFTTVTCTFKTNVPAKSSVATGTDKGNLIPTPDNHYRTAHSITVKGEMPNTSYYALATVTAKNGQTAKPAWAGFKTAAPGSIPAKSTPPKKRVNLNGSLFFPVLADQVGTCLTPAIVAEETAMGINTIAGRLASCPDVSALDKQAWYIDSLGDSQVDPKLIESADALPSLLGWIQEPEPELSLSPADLPAAPENGRLTFMVVGFAWWENDAVPWLGQGPSPGPWNQVYGHYIEKADALVWERHPYAGSCLSDTLGGTYGHLVGLASHSGNKAVLDEINVAQNSLGASCHAPQPTANRVAAQFWTAIIAKVNGISYVTQHIGSLAITITPVIRAQVTKQDKQLATLAPVLLYGKPVAVGSDPTSPVRYGAWSYQGTTYVVAVNTQETTVSASFSTADSTNRTAHVMWENRSVKTTSGKFGPLAARIYQMVPAAKQK